MTTKVDFMRKVDGVDRNGALHKAKLASHIYDLVEEKIREKRFPKTDSSAHDVFMDKLVEVTQKVEEMEQSYLSLNEKIDALDEKLNSFEESFRNKETKITTAKSKKALKLKEDK